MLKILINALKALPDDANFTNGFDEAMSYRGYYSELGLNPCGQAKASEMLKVLESAVGETFAGYKGGEYTMNDSTECYLASYGSCGDQIVGIQYNDSSINEYSLVLMKDSF